MRRDVSWSHLQLQCRLICAIFARQRTRCGGVPACCVVSYLGASAGRCRANAAHIRQPRPDFDLAFQVTVVKKVEVVPTVVSGGRPRGAEPAVSAICCRVSSAQIRQSWPAPGLGFQVVVTQTLSSCSPFLQAAGRGGDAEPAVPALRPPPDHLMCAILTVLCVPY